MKIKIANFAPLLCAAALEKPFGKSSFIQI